VEAESPKTKPVQHLCDQAKIAIQELREAGIEPTLDEVCWLNDLGRQVEDPEGGEHRHAAGQPSKAGNIWLWPFTIQGERWYEKTLKWFDGQPELEMYALAFALAKGREPGAFDFLSGYDSSKKAVDAFSSGALACTQEELCAAIVDVMPGDSEIDELEAEFLARDFSEQDEAPKPLNWDKLVETLVAATGIERDVWMRKDSKAHALAVLDAINKQQEAIAGGRAKEVGPDPNDPYIVAVKNLGVAMRAIKERHSKSKEAASG